MTRKLFGSITFLDATVLDAIVLVATVLAATALPLHAQPPAEAESVRVSFDISYQPWFSPRDEPWDLYVYLDGDFLAWIPKGGQFAPTPPERFTRQLSPGPHLIRFLVENHERRSGGFTHEAKAAPFQLFFRFEPGGWAEVELRYLEVQALLKSESHPFSALVRQNGQIVQNIDNAGSPPSLWPFLCEEVETWLDEAGKGPRKVLRNLEHCARWESLWPGVEDAPPRDEIRDLLERYAYQPRTYKRFQ